MKYLPLLIITICVLSACQRPPEYEDTPRISFEDAAFIPSAGDRRIDTVRVTVQFQDGDGDLGEVANTGSGSPNFILNLFRKEDGDFRMIAPSSGSFSGTFPSIDNQPGESGPLEGTITYNYTDLLLLTGLIRRGDTLRAEVQIRDRSQKLSNTVLSEPFAVPEE